jgi:hypothetical protein
VKLALSARTMAEETLRRAEASVGTERDNLLWIASEWEKLAVQEHAGGVSMADYARRRTAFSRRPAARSQG